MTNDQAILGFLTAVKVDFQRTADEKDLNASGKTVGSLAIEGNALTGSSNLYYLEHGRGPGSMPPVESIEGWIKNRGLNDYNPWAVAKSIAEKGTRIFRNKSLGISISEIATKYYDELVRNVQEAYVEKLLKELDI